MISFIGLGFRGEVVELNRVTFVDNKNGDDHEFGFLETSSTKKIAMMNESCIVEICPSLVSFVTVETCM